jgi:hypothetical protein
MRRKPPLYFYTKPSGEAMKLAPGLTAVTLPSRKLDVTYLEIVPGEREVD